MNVLQLILFSWVSVWVLCDSLLPDSTYRDRIKACGAAACAVGYANNAHGELWKKIKRSKTPK